MDRVLKHARTLLTLSLLIALATPPSMPTLQAEPPDVNPEPPDQAQEPEVVVVDVPFVDEPEVVPGEDSYIKCLMELDRQLQGTLILPQPGGFNSLILVHGQMTFVDRQTGQSVILRLGGNRQTRVEFEGEQLLIRFSFSGANLVVPGFRAPIHVGDAELTIGFDPITNEPLFALGFPDEVTGTMICEILSM